MTITRRRFVSCSAVATGALAAPAIITRAAAADAIKLGCLLDLGGPLGVYGQPMFYATKLAVKRVNNAGGLRNRPVSIVSYDTQSNIHMYAHDRYLPHRRS